VGNFGSTLTGLAEVQTRLRKAKSDTEGRLRVTLAEEANTVLDAARASVPVDKGELRDSGAVSPVTVEGSAFTVAVGFGSGPSAAYAAAVHETPSPFDPSSWRTTPPHFRVGGPKFLERPIKEASEGMAERIVAKLFKED